MITALGRIAGRGILNGLLPGWVIAVWGVVSSQVGTSTRGGLVVYHASIAKHPGALIPGLRGRPIVPIMLEHPVLRILGQHPTNFQHRVFALSV